MSYSSRSVARNKTIIYPNPLIDKFGMEQYPGQRLLIFFFYPQLHSGVKEQR